MIKLRALFKWASLILLLLFFIPWIITFAIYFGAPFLVTSGFGLSAFVYGGLIFLYYLFPFACVFYFFKVCLIKVTEKKPRFIWMILPFIVAIPLAIIVNYSLTAQKMAAKKEISYLMLVTKAIINTKAPAPGAGSTHVMVRSVPMHSTYVPNVSQYPHKSYLRTCMGCNTKNNKLRCSCQDSDGVYNDTELDLTTVKNKQLQIQNCDGHLTADVERCP